MLETASVGEALPAVFKVMGSIPSTTKSKFKNKEFVSWDAAQLI